MSRTSKKGRTEAEDDDYNRLEDIADSIAGRVVDADGNISDENVTADGVKRRMQFEKDSGAYFELHHDEAPTESNIAEQEPSKGSNAGAEDDDYNKFEDFLDEVAGRLVDEDGNIVDDDVTEEGIAARKSIEEKTGIDVDHHIQLQEGQQQATDNNNNNNNNNNNRSTAKRRRNNAGAEDDDVNRYEDFVDEVTGRVVDADGNISDEDVTEEGITKRRKVEEKGGFVDKVHPESSVLEGATDNLPKKERGAHQGAEDDDFNKYEDAVDKATGRVIDADGNISDAKVTEQGVAQRRKMEEKGGFVDKVHPVVGNAAV